MENYIEYLRTPDINTLEAYKAVLEKHGIPFEVDDSAFQFNLSIITGTGNPWDNQFILRIKKDDTKKVDKLFQK